MLYLYCSPTHNSHRTQLIFNMKGRTNGKRHPSVKLLRMSDREAESGMEKKSATPDGCAPPLPESVTVMRRYHTSDQNQLKFILYIFINHLSSQICKT